jgi:hypothetical protein
MFISCLDIRFLGRMDPISFRRNGAAMAEIQILSPEALHEREHKPKGRSGRQRSEARTHIIEEYKAILQTAPPGYGGDVTLAEGEEKRRVRQNLQEAAKELNRALDFRPIRDPARLAFRVITPEEAAQKPRRGGRPRKAG